MATRISGGGKNQSIPRTQMIQIPTVYYATPPANYFWQWSSEYDATIFYGDQTCALWDEIQPILQYFGEDGGLPPLGAILLLVAACRDNGERLIADIELWVSSFHAGQPQSSGCTNTQNDLRDAFLLIGRLPAKLRNSLEAKCALIATVFENSPQRLSLEESLQTITELTERGPECLRSKTADLSGLTRFFRDTKGVIEGLKGHTVQSLESILVTGIPAITLPPATIPNISESNRSEPTTLIDQIREPSDEGRLLAGIAERAIAMIHLPGSVNRPDEIPVGGIADITNRGTIDRLLLAELAHDDLTLAVRLVNNEALFFRREVPPRETAKKNAVFLDRGIRMWGLNRLFALGFALGITHKDGWKHEESETFTAKRNDQWQKVDLHALSQIKDLLSELIPITNPAGALRSWWAELNEKITGDVAFVTIAEHLETPDTSRTLGEIAISLAQHGSALFAINVARDGAIEVQRWTVSGVRVEFRGKIDISDLVETPTSVPKQAAKLVQSESLYKKGISPFLFPLSPNTFNSVEYYKGGVLGTIDSRLLRWETPEKGGAEWFTSLPGKRQKLISNGPSTYLITMGEPGDSVELFRVEEDDLKPIPIPPSRHSYPLAYQCQGHYLLLGYSDYVEVFSIPKCEKVSG
ncbi:MAG: hypothetical protein AAF226_03950, partial [Verrucomicrobiota bacterium]